MSESDKYSLLLSKMQRICSLREYCSHEIEQKLKKQEASDSTITRIITSLKEDKFIDDRRYAVAFLKDKSRLFGWGKRKIIFALKYRRVPEEIIKESLLEIDVDQERGTLQKILEQKLKSFDTEEEKDKIRVRLIRFALSRGFDYEKTMAIVNKIVC